jgi:hypothetical protein
MPEVNFEWVRQQMQDAKVKVGSGNMILKLLEVWADDSKLSAGMAKEAAEMFSKLALNQSLSDPKPNADEVWVQAMPGHIVVGDEVRVKTDAFGDTSGTMHNGRRGKVTGIRYGDIIVNITDNKQPVLSGVHYSPDKLEKRVR